MTMKDEIKELLNKEIEVSEDDLKLYNAMVPVFNRFYQNVEPKRRLEWTVSSAAYLFGKALEKEILAVIRPEYDKIWCLPQEVEEGITFNLPHHIEDKVIDYMDSFESALEEHIYSNMNFDLQSLWVKSQVVGKEIEKIHKLSSLTTGGLTNDKVMTLEEMYFFGLHALIMELKNRGFEVEGRAPSFAEAISVVAKKDGKLYFIAASVTMLPKTGSLGGYKYDALMQLSKAKNAIPVFTGVGIISKNELYASQGIAIKDGEYDCKISALNIIKDEGTEVLE